MDISSLRNCNCKPFAVCMYIIDGNAHHFESIIWYIGGKYHKQQHQSSPVIVECKFSTKFVFFTVIGRFTVCRMQWLLGNNNTVY